MTRRTLMFIIAAVMTISAAITPMAAAKGPEYGYSLRAMVSLEQSQSPWGGKTLCGSASVASGGCGYTSMSMIGQTLTGKSKWTPTRIDHKFPGICDPSRPAGSQVSWITGKDFVLEVGDWMGLDGAYVGEQYGIDFEQINAVLRMRGLVIVSFSGPPFASKGHYLVIRGYTPGKGYWFADPYGTGQHGFKSENRPFPGQYLKEHGMFRAWTFV